MGHGLLHQSNASGRIGTVLARSKDSHGLGEKVGVGGITLRGDARRDQADLLYLEVRRGTQVAQGRGLQNLHSWVRIPPAPPSPPLFSSAGMRRNESFHIETFSIIRSSTGARPFSFLRTLF